MSVQDELEFWSQMVDAAFGLGLTKDMARAMNEHYAVCWKALLQDTPDGRV